MKVPKTTWERLLLAGLKPRPPMRQQANEHSMVAFNKFMNELDHAPENWSTYESNGESLLMPPLVTGMFAQFKAGGERIFKIARNFGEQLSKVDLSITSQHLPHHQAPISIEFPENMKFPIRYMSGEEFYTTGAIVWSVPIGNGPDAYHFSSYRTGNDVAAYLLCVVPLYREGETVPTVYDTMKISLANNEAMDIGIRASINRHAGLTTKEGMVTTEDPQEPKLAFDLYIFIAKCLAYIASGEPDLREYRPPRIKSDKPKKVRQFQREHEDQSLVPVTLVGFDFKKPHTYRVGEVDVIGHFRWQIYGPGFSKVKLIWIEPHVRHYNKQKGATNETT